MKFNRVIWVYATIASILVSGCAAPAAGDAAASAASSATGTPTPAVPSTTTTGSGTTVNVSPSQQKCCPHETLWEFLGLKNLFLLLGKLGSRIRNLLGSRFPGLEAQPALLAITDPKNLDSSNPAVKTAAGVKADEDQSAQKVKAIRYLATIGCGGCYPDVEAALLAALDDCTEAVRYEAVKALRDMAGRPCAVCKAKSCCGPKVIEKLRKVANDQENGCYKEPSARVRRLARLTVAGCGNPAAIVKKELPQEGPSVEPEPDEGPVKDKIMPKGKTASATRGSVLNSVANSDYCPECGDEPPAYRPRSKRTTPTLAEASENDADSAPATTSVMRKRGVATPATPHVSADAAPRDGGDSGDESTNRKAAAGEQPSAGDGVTQVSALSAAKAPPAPAAPPAPVGKPLAYVNGDPIYEDAVLPQIDRQLGRLAAEARTPAARQAALARELQHAIDRKLLCQEARRATSGDGVRTVSFNDAGQLPDPSSVLASPAYEQTLADNWLRRAVRVNETVSPDEIAKYYRTNAARFQRPDEVRIERLTASWGAFANPDEARWALTHLRNRAMGIASQPQTKVNYAAVRIETLDWIRRDELPTPVAEQRFFTMPLGEFSPLLEDPDGIQTLRVIDRHTAGAAPLESVAGAIQQQIVGQRREAAEQSYLQRLRAQARLWTVLDHPAEQSAGR